MISEPTHLARTDQVAPLNATPAVDYRQNRRLESGWNPEASEVDSFAGLRASWDILLKHRWLILAVAVILTAFVTIYSFKVPPVYRATARISIEAEAPPIQTLNDLFRNVYSDYFFLATQIGVLKSNDVAWQTIQQLGPSIVGDFGSRSGRQAVVGPPLASKVALTSQFQARLHIEQEKESRLVSVSFESISPDLAARVVNALIHNYIEYNFRAKFDATRQATGWMEQQLEELKVKVERSQQALIDYERQNSIVALGDKQNVAESRLQDLTTDLTKAQSDRIQRESWYKLVQSSEDQAGLIRNSPLLQNLETKEADLREQYLDAVEHYGPTYPKVVRLQDQIKDLQLLVQKARRRAVEDIRNEYLAALAHENLMVEAVAQQKAEIGKVNQLLIQHNLLKRDFESNQQLYDNLLHRLKDANVSAGLKATNIHVVDQADPPTYPVRPNKTRNILFGAAAGLVLGTVLALGLETLDRSVKGAQEVERIIAAPALAIIPTMASFGRLRKTTHGLLGSQSEQAPDGKVRPELAVLRAPSAAISESFRTLRTSLLLSAADRPPQAVLVTSSNSAEGKTSTTMNLAASLAQKGSTVVIVDADLRQPGIARALDLPNAMGLTGLLTGVHELSDALLRVQDLTNLWVLTSGPRPPNPAELLCSAKMESLLKQLRQQFDHVILDSPPVLPLTDAAILASIVDGVLMVVQYHETPRDHLARAGRVIHQSGGKILGAVLNKADPYLDGYYGKYRYYGYEPYYLNEKDGTESGG